jgi:signal transduction histidine kinase
VTGVIAVCDLTADLPPARAAARAAARARRSPEATPGLEDARADRIEELIFTASAHQLRTQLTTILMWSRVLRDERAGAAQHAQAADAIHHSALVQLRIFGDLLDVLRALGGALQVDRRAIDVDRLLREALAAIGPAALARQIELVLRDAPAPGRVRGDDARLRQALDRLLESAVERTDAGGRVIVSVARAARAISIAIEDGGRGLAPEILRRLFEPLASGRGVPLPPADGDLGLVLAKLIAGLHHGELLAEDPAPGHGAKLTLRLPLEDRRRVGRVRRSHPSGDESVRTPIPRMKTDLRSRRGGPT